MKKIFLYFLLYLVPFLGVSQLKKVVYKDNSGFSHQQGFINQLGNKDSCWVYYDDSGKISSIANYKNGIKNGDWLIYHNNGKLSFEMKYSNGKMMYGRRWDEDGNLIEEK
jgi:antitoxin component YwqK of YwqJK toxin-antitoxin module